ncbi:uncharacterized protein UV8b_03825 [Ustilaginoidea virens]|uniref:Extracellular membrane protein CFEM domain-containing protein n=1 Tax=Ustilaginoidea virens TaxID=1159556 RepID=A0A8E5HQB5_USTVR|nr:uncharacterized protein UV8b_03825 [Ustilaginoidea virens]QUC19584.1 hypothetical protein UV8b_03825 [Ustilaginoidea virens]
MQLPRTATWLAVALSVGRVGAQTTKSDIIAIAASDFPHCTLDCIRPSNLLDSNCTNSICACRLDDALDDARSCLRRSCGYPDILAAKHITSSACNGRDYRRDSAGAYKVMNMALSILTGVVCISRFVFKRKFSAARRYTPDDWILMSAFAVGLPCALVNRHGLVHSGLGRDAWTLTTDDIYHFAIYFYILEILYTICMALIKLTLLAFYLTLFLAASTSVWTRRLLWGSITFQVVLATVTIMLAVFQCSPVSYYWKQLVASDASASCIASTPIVWTNASLNVALDIWIVLIPLREVRNLRMPLRKKLGVIFMFLMGTFVTVVSILRLSSIYLTSASINITWDYLPLALWSTVEINVGIICTCLPTLRLIFMSISPKVCGSQEPRSKTVSKSTEAQLGAAASRRQRRLSSLETNVGTEEGELGAYAGPKFNVVVTDQELGIPFSEGRGHQE